MKGEIMNLIAVVAVSARSALQSRACAETLECWSASVARGAQKPKRAKWGWPPAVEPAVKATAARPWTAAAKSLRATVPVCRRIH